MMNPHMDFPGAGPLQPQPSMHMERFGKDIGEAQHKGRKNDADRRIKRGECPDCGQKTHKINLVTRKKTPLTRENEVLYGQCLKCRPIEGYAKRPPRPAIPHNIVAVNKAEDDEDTLVSGITMDMMTVLRMQAPPEDGDGSDKGHKEDGKGGDHLSFEDDFDKPYDDFNEDDLGFRNSPGRNRNIQSEMERAARAEHQRQTYGRDDSAGGLSSVEPSPFDSGKAELFGKAMGMGSKSSNEISHRSFQSEGTVSAANGLGRTDYSRRMFGDSQVGSTRRLGDLKEKPSGVSSGRLGGPRDETISSSRLGKFDEEYIHLRNQQSHREYRAANASDQLLGRMREEGQLGTKPLSGSHRFESFKHSGGYESSRQLGNREEEGAIMRQSSHTNESLKHSSGRSGYESSSSSSRRLVGQSSRMSLTSQKLDGTESSHELNETMPTHSALTSQSFDDQERGMPNGGTYPRAGKRGSVASSEQSYGVEGLTRQPSAMQRRQSGQQQPPMQHRKQQHRQVSRRSMIADAAEHSRHILPPSLQEVPNDYNETAPPKTGFAAIAASYLNNERLPHHESATPPAAAAFASAVEATSADDRSLGSSEDLSRQSHGGGSYRSRQTVESDKKLPAAPSPGVSQRNLFSGREEEKDEERPSVAGTVPYPLELENSPYRNMGVAGSTRQSSVEAGGLRREQTPIWGGFMDHQHGDHGEAAEAAATAAGVALANRGYSYEGADGSFEDDAAAPPDEAVVRANIAAGAVEAGVASARRRMSLEDEEEEEEDQNDDDVDYSPAAGAAHLALTPSGINHGERRGSTETGTSIMSSSRKRGPTIVEEADEEEEEQQQQQQEEEEVEENRKPAKHEILDGEDAPDHEQQYRLQGRDVGDKEKDRHNARTGTSSRELRRSVEGSKWDNSMSTGDSSSRSLHSRVAPSDDAKLQGQHALLSSPFPDKRQPLAEMLESDLLRTDESSEKAQTDAVSIKSAVDRRVLKLYQRLSEQNLPGIDDDSSSDSECEEEGREALEVIVEGNPEDVSAANYGRAMSMRSIKSGRSLRSTWSTQSTRTRYVTGKDGVKRRISKVSDIPLILRCINLHEDNELLHRRAFEALTALACRPDSKGKISIVVNRGIRTVVKGMWRHMGKAQVQGAALDLLWALSANPEVDGVNDTMTDSHASGMVDTLLISMQSHLGDPAVQVSGCGLLCSLASASANNNRVDDGTSSGATLSIINAMKDHPKHAAVQEWGLRALYGECRNSDDNKVDLTKDGMGEYSYGGAMAIHNAVKAFPEELRILELSCRLYWCLSSNETAAIALSVTSKSIHSVLESMRTFSEVEAAAGLHEAACGTLGNLAAAMDKNRLLIRGSSGAKEIIHSMLFFGESEGVQLEACSALANLAVSRQNVSAIVRDGGVMAVLLALKAFPQNQTLQEEACRALLCFCAESLEAKEILSSEDVIAAVVKTLRRHMGSIQVEEAATGLLSTLALQSTNQSRLISLGGLDVIIEAMQCYPRERNFQEIACSALRNLSDLETDETDLMCNSEIVHTIVRSMHAHPHSAKVQEHCCCALWNLCARSEREPVSIMEASGIKYIVKAMQTLPEDAVVQEVACGALWSLVDGSDARKDSLAMVDGIDAVICAMVMHPNEVGPLEKATGVLSSLSAREYAASIVDSGGIGVVIESMTRHMDSVPLLEFGALVLRNLAAVQKRYADEAVPSVTTILRGMREHQDAVGLQREGCYALWALASASEICKDRIVSADGVEIIMRTMEHNSCVKEIQAAGRGAFDELVS